MARTSTERETAKQQIRDVLYDVARRRKTITYVDLVSRVDAMSLHERSGDLHQILGEISEEEDAAGKGMLSAVVVAKESGVPGSGFFELARKLGRDLSDELSFWRQERDRLRDAYSAHRSAVSERAISVRLDGDAEEALELLVESGLTRSEAIREALVSAAERLRRVALAEEARQLAADADDKAAIAEISVFMDALSAEG